MKLSRATSLWLGATPTVLVWANDGSCFAVADVVGAVRVLDMQGLLMAERALHRGSVRALAWSSLGLLASAGEDGRVEILDRSLRVRASLPIDARRAEHVAWHPSGKLLAVAAGESVRLFAADGEPYLETASHPGDVGGLVFRASGDLVTCAPDGTYLWDVGLDNRRAPLRLPFKGTPVSLAISPNQRVVACASQEAMIHIWRLDTQRKAEMRGYRFAPSPLAWDTSSKMLATGGDKAICVWHFSGKGPEGTRPTVLQGHDGSVTALDFHPRRTIVASGAEDHEILLWAPRRRDAPLHRASLGARVVGLAFSPAGTRLTATDHDGCVGVFSL